MANKLLVCLAAAWAGVVCAQEVTPFARAESSVERLDRGEYWQRSAVTVGASSVSESIKSVEARVETESRAAGSAQKFSLSATAPVGKTSAIQTTLSVGNGAAYAYRSQQQVTLYSSLGSLESSAGVYRTEYLDTEVLGAQGYVRKDLFSGVTGILAGQASKSGGYLSVGLEKSFGTCLLRIQGYDGSELRNANVPAAGTQDSRSTVLTGRCELAKGVHFELAASRTEAGPSSREGVTGAVVFSFCAPRRVDLDSSLFGLRH